MTTPAPALSQNATPVTGQEAIEFEKAKELYQAAKAQKIQTNTVEAQSLDAQSSALASQQTVIAQRKLKLQQEREALESDEEKD